MFTDRLLTQAAYHGAKFIGEEIIFVLDKTRQPDSVSFNDNHFNKKTEMSYIELCILRF